MTCTIIIFFTFLFCFLDKFDPFVHMLPLSKNQLDINFYDESCPNLATIVRYEVWSAIKNDNRFAASLLRLHFHDCIGCDASVLLDDTPYFTGEKNAFPNRNSLSGLEVIDNIKEQVERQCPSTVSCADILSLAVREAIDLLGGPSWSVAFGRRDAITTTQMAANEQIPSPFEPLDNIIAKFSSKGLDLRDVVALSGAHTIGYARCMTFKRRLFDFEGSGKPDPLLDNSLLSKLQNTCPNRDTSNSNIAPLDANTSLMFDNEYYRNLVYDKGLLESDQALMRDRRTASMAYYYSTDQSSFYNDFAASMAKLSNVGVLTGIQGQIRKKCGSVN